MSMRQQDCVTLRLLRFSSNSGQKVIPVNSGNVRQETHFEEVSQTISCSRSQKLCLELFLSSEAHAEIDENAGVPVD